MDYLHLINNGRNYYVYIPATYNIVRTNKLAYTAIQMLQTGIVFVKHVTCLKVKLSEWSFF